MYALAFDAGVQSFGPLRFWVAAYDASLVKHHGARYGLVAMSIFYVRSSDDTQQLRLLLFTFR
jgi:hypothetical protein